MEKRLTTKVDGYKIVIDPDEYVYSAEINGSTVYPYVISSRTGEYINVSGIYTVEQIISKLRNKTAVWG